MNPKAAQKPRTKTLIGLLLSLSLAAGTALAFPAAAQDEPNPCDDDYQGDENCCDENSPNYDGADDCGGGPEPGPCDDDYQGNEPCCEENSPNYDGADDCYHCPGGTGADAAICQVFRGVWFVVEKVKELIIPGG